MSILKSRYGFDSIALRRTCVRLADVKPRSLVMDMGTGSGWMAIIGSLSDLRVVSVDLSVAAIQKARDRIRNIPERERRSIHFTAADGLALPFSSNEFDAVFTFDAIHHFADFTCAKAILEMVRVCRPRGRVVLSDLNSRGIEAVNEVVARSGEMHDSNRCTPSRIPDLLVSSGLNFTTRELDFVTVYVIQKR